MKDPIAALYDRLTPEAAAALRQALPNAVTILALMVGLTGLVYAATDRIVPAISCVLLAAVLDACDGRVARYTGSTSKFGAELDSLSDVVCFGAVPSFILYRWGLNQFGTVGWISCLTLASASALRLARFNVMVDSPDRPPWMTNFFVGVPAPAGAFLGLSPIYAGNAEILSFDAALGLGLVTTPLVAGLMISKWPTFSAKGVSRKALRLMFVPSLILGVVTAIELWAKPWMALSLCTLAYLASLPLSRWRYDHLSRRGRRL